MKTTAITHSLYFLMILSISACEQKSDEEKTIASTHPKLEQQLDQNPLQLPVQSGKDTSLYARYRITMSEYENRKDYTVPDHYTGPLAPLDEASHRDASKFRTALRNGLKEGINFAGKYTLVSIGCGTSCQTYYVVDRQTGKLLDKIVGTAGAEYRPDSRLFVLNPPDSSINYQECRYCKPEIFIFENNRFRKLRLKEQ